jgi:hypothetical protein
MTSSTSGIFCGPARLYFSNTLHPALALNII